MKKLIVSADDFGLTNSVNEGIARSLRDGIVTSVNLAPSGSAFDNALSIMRGLGLKDAGAHLALTETSPVTEPRKISTLIAKDGRFFRNRNKFFIRLLSNHIDTAHIYTELNNQLDKISQAGIRVTHLSGHEHIHMMPPIRGIFFRLAKERTIPAIRHLARERFSWPANLRKIYRLLILLFFEKGMRRSLDEAGIRCADNIAGFYDSGKLNENVLIDILRSLKDGTTELVCHPGLLGPEILDRYRFHINCEKELYALTSKCVRNLIDKSGIKLISYRDFLEMK